MQWKALKSTKHINAEVDCFALCDVLRLFLKDYLVMDKDNFKKLNYIFDYE